MWSQQRVNVNTAHVPQGGEGGGGNGQRMMCLSSPCLCLQRIAKPKCYHVFRLQRA